MLLFELITISPRPGSLPMNTTQFPAWRLSFYLLSVNLASSHLAVPSPNTPVMYVP